MPAYGDRMKLKLDIDFGGTAERNIAIILMGWMLKRPFHAKYVVAVDLASHSFLAF